MIPTALLPGSISTILSTNAKGYLWGRNLSISVEEKTVSTSLVKAEMASAPLKVVAVSSTVADKEVVARGALWEVKALVHDKEAKRKAAIFMV